MPSPKDRIRNLAFESNAEFVPPGEGDCVDRRPGGPSRCAQALMPSARIVVNDGEVARCLERRRRSQRFGVCVRLDTRTRVEPENRQRLRATCLNRRGIARKPHPLNSWGLPSYTCSLSWLLRSQDVFIAGSGLQPNHYHFCERAAAHAKHDVHRRRTTREGCRWATSRPLSRRKSAESVSTTHCVSWARRRSA